MFRMETIEDGFTAELESYAGELALQTFAEIIFSFQF